MFNLAKKKNNKYLQEKRMHCDRVKDKQSMDQALQEDATRMALDMVRRDVKPAYVFDDWLAAEYWQYVDRNHPGYITSLFEQARLMAKDMRKNPDKYVPIAAPAPPSGAGGGMPPMASSRRPAKIAGSMFLSRAKGRYRLRDTMVGALLSGSQQYAGEDGANYLLRLRGGHDVSVPRESASASEAVRIQEEMPSAVRRAITRFMKDEGIDGSARLARIIADSTWRDRTINVLPLSLRVVGPEKGFLMIERVEGELEPMVASKLRRVIGQAMVPYMDRLKSALSMDSIEFDEVPAAMPPYTEAGARQRHEENDLPDRPPARSNPVVLHVADVARSLDVPSLAMTAANEASGNHATVAAANRLVQVMCLYPSLYQNDKISAEDVLDMTRSSGSSRDEAASRAMERLARFVALFDAPDEALLRDYAKANSIDKALLSRMASGQDREGIISSSPSMAIPNATPNPGFIRRLDPSDGEAMIVIRKALELAHGAPSRDLVRKVMQAIHDNGDEELVRGALSGGRVLRAFALVHQMEHGMMGEALDALARSRHEPGEPGPGAMVAMAVERNAGGDPAAMRMVMMAYGTRPRDVMDKAGWEVAIAYMRANGVDMDGDGIPAARDIYSLPDNPIDLAKTYYEMARDGGDEGYVAGLVRLLQLCAGHEDDERAAHAAKYIRDALDALGAGDHARMSMMTTPIGKGKAPIKARVLPDGLVMIKKSGRFTIRLPRGARPCFACSDRHAERIALAISQGRQPGIS